MSNYFLLLDLSMFKVHSLGIQWKKYGANVFPCKTPVAMLKKCVSQSGEKTTAFMVLKSSIIVVTVFLGRPYACSISSIFPVCMESNVLEKSPNDSVALRFFAPTPSMIQQIVRICDVNLFPKNCCDFSKECFQCQVWYSREAGHYVF